MTRVTVSIEIDESVDPAQLGTWLEAWIRDQWDGHGEPSSLLEHCCDLVCDFQGQNGLCEHATLHLRAVKAQPPASGKSKAQSKRELRELMGSFVDLD